MRASIASVISLAVLAAFAGGAPASEAEGVIKDSGQAGGICLIVGAGDLKLTGDLAGKGFYVQVLQPDGTKALAWGAKVSAADWRENASVRNAAFDAGHYGSKLFNLVVVEDSAALGKAKLADLCRVVVPRGVIFFRKDPGALAAGAATLKMEVVSAPGFAKALRRPLLPVEWKPVVEQKWQAGPRSQIANGFAGVCTGGGKLFYVEHTELDTGDLKASAGQLHARDAHNGRAIWSVPVGGYRPHGWHRAVCTSDGKVFVQSGSKLVCVDGNTGKIVGEVPARMSKGRTDIRVLNDDILLVAGQVCSIKTLKVLWTFPRVRYIALPEVMIGDSVFFCDGQNIFGKKLIDGKALWTVAVSKLPKPAGKQRLSAAGKYLVVRTKGAKDLYCFSVLDSTDGRVLWSYSWKIRISAKERYFDARRVRVTTAGKDLLVYYRHNKPTVYADEFVVTRLDLATGKERVKDKILNDAGDFHGCFGELRLGDYIAWYDLWIDTRKLETIRLHTPHPACFFGSNHGYGRIFNFPSRKSGPITAVGPADTDRAFSKEAAKRELKRLGSVSGGAPTGPNDWPMFRCTPSGGNFIKASIGTKPVKVWEAQVGRPGTNFGLMSSERTGLTQAVVAYGLAVVGDIDGGRVVALDVKDGKQKWAYHVGARVDYPPTLHKGLCLVASRDGWVHCLDAKTGKPVYRLQTAPHQRYIGGLEKLESRWAPKSDVLIVKDVAYVAAPGGGLAFKPATGQIVNVKNASGVALGKAKTPGGRDLYLSHHMMLKGNSIPRTNEDNKHGFRRGKFKRKFESRVLTFDGSRTVAYHFHPKGEGWANKGTLDIKEIAGNPKKPVWKTPAIELVVADMVLTPEHVYCAGHYQRVKKKPELWVLSRKDGSVVSKTPAGGFPAFMGMSAAGKRLFMATRDGKLICYQAK